MVSKTPWVVHMKFTSGKFPEKRIYSMNPKGSRITYTLDSVWDAYHLAQKVCKFCLKFNLFHFPLPSHPSTDLIGFQMVSAISLG